MRERGVAHVLSALVLVGRVVARLRQIFRLPVRQARTTNAPAPSLIDLSAELRRRAASRRTARTSTERASQPPTAQCLRLFERFNGEHSLIVAEPAFGAHVFGQAFHLMQVSVSKIVDLTEVDVIGGEFFAGLAHAWCTPAGTVPRLAIVLSFERWALLQEEAASCVAALAAKGTELVLFYREQGIVAVTQWLTDGVVRHDVEFAIGSLVRDSRFVTAAWPQVVRAAAALVRSHAESEQAPRLLACLADIALACGDPLIAEPLAREALAHADVAPKAFRALGLRTLGAILIAQGRGTEGIHALEIAVTAADVSGDPRDLAATLCHLGTYHLAFGGGPRAEGCFRRVLTLNVGGDVPGVAHHGLAVALLQQGRELPAAAHAAMARQLRRDPITFASFDDALFAELQARQALTN